MSLVQVARDFSPRVETHGDGTVTLDISGLGSLIGEPRVIGEELRRSAAEAGLRVHIAVAATTRAAILLAHARAGLTVIPPGGEAAALAPLPLSTLLDAGVEPELDHLRRWGLRTLGDLAALPAPDVSARLGQQGLRWQKWARGEDSRPLVPARVAESYQESLDLEWPIDELEPLSFVLARLFETLCERLERGDRGAVTLHVALTLITSASAGGRELHERVVELPAPMRDPRVLRTLALLDLESHPPPAAIDRVTVRVDVAEGRVLQFGLFARALPSDKLTTLMARLGALMGSDRVGAPALVDTYRPGAFAMAKFEPAAAPGAADVRPAPVPASVLRRFRLPIPARVTVEQGRPVRVVTDRRGLGGGRVERCDGPWRSSGDWWNYAPYASHAPRPWDCDEWDVMLSDGAAYRLSQSRNDGAWFVEGLVD
jgi:protein ImuB